MPDPTRPDIGVWSQLPPTISERARTMAKAMQQLTRPSQASPPRTTAEWKAANEATIAGSASPLVQGALNIHETSTREEVIDGASHTWFLPKDVSSNAQDSSVLLDMHGGAYLMGAPQIEAPIVSPLVSALGCPALSVRYPLWWELPPPADVDRVVAVYRHLLKSRNSRSIVMCGASAGGGLVLRTALRLRELGEPLPAALVLMSPWADVTCCSDSWGTLAAYDTLTPDIGRAIETILGRDRYLERDLSPVQADFQGFPPCMLVTGTRDALLSDCARLQRRFVEAGVSHELRIYEGMWHTFNILRIPEAQECVADIECFIRKHLGGHSR